MIASKRCLFPTCESISKPRNTANDAGSAERLSEDDLARGDIARAKSVARIVFRRAGKVTLECKLILLLLPGQVAHDAEG